MECDPIGDQESVALPRRCGARLASGVPETAVRYLERALPSSRRTRSEDRCRMSSVLLRVPAWPRGRDQQSGGIARPGAYGPAIRN